MGRSTVPTFKKALVDDLDAATWPDGKPQVCYGDPITRSREDVIIGDTAQTGDDQQDWAALGNRTREENYALNLMVDVVNPGETCEQAVERAFDLFAVIEGRLRSNPTMGIAGLVVSDLRQPVHTESQTDEGWVCQIESAVRVQARI